MFGWFKSKEDCRTIVEPMVAEKPMLNDYNLSKYIYERLNNVRYVEAKTTNDYLKNSYPKIQRRCIDFTIEDNDGNHYLFHVGLDIINEKTDKVWSYKGHQDISF